MPSASSTEWSVTMCGWFSAATARASRWKREAIGIVRRLGGQHFERDVAAELQVRGTVDQTHGTRANLRGNAVVAESPSGHILR